MTKRKRAQRGRASETARALAAARMLDAGMTLAEIARVLGYSDHSGARRAAQRGRALDLRRLELSAQLPPSAGTERDPIDTATLELLRRLTEQTGQDTRELFDAMGETWRETEQLLKAMRAAEPQLPNGGRG